MRFSLNNRLGGICDPSPATVALETQFIGLAQFGYCLSFLKFLVEAIGASQIGKGESVGCMLGGAKLVAYHVQWVFKLCNSIVFFLPFEIFFSFPYPSFEEQR